MANRRGQGEGSISKHMKNGKWDGTWWARITVGKDENGKQLRKAFYGKSKKDVQDKLREALNGSGHSALQTPDMLLEQWALKWLHDYNRLVVKPTTYMSNTGYMRNHVIPAMGQFPIKDLRSSTIQEFIADKMNEGKLAPQSIQHIIFCLRSCLNQAVKNDLIKKNPVIGTELPKKNEKRRQALTKEEQKKFIAEAKNTPVGEIFILILATGLRLGEALALTWGDIDFNECLLFVNKTQVLYTNPDEPDGKCILTTNPPKTKSSNRYIYLLPNIVEMLNRRKQLCIEQSTETNFIEKFIFCNASGKMLYGDTARDAFQRILKDAGIKSYYTPHCLRHSFATRGLENGIPLKVMQELLGHSSIRMTADLYTHVLPDTKNESVMKLEDAYLFMEDEAETGG